MLELKAYQEKAVKDLKEKIVDMMQLHAERQKIVFKAPTGAGKTVMASALLDKLNIEFSSNYNDVAFIWIAPNKLHVQSYMSMRNFFSETRSLRPVMFNEVDSMSGLQGGDILFLNWQSIYMENAVIIRENEQNRNLYTLVKSTRDNCIPVIVVIDEEHMYTGVNARRCETVLNKINAKVELRISATPITVGCPLIDVPREKVIAEEVIKKGIYLNPQLHGSDNQEVSLNIHLLEAALKRRNALAKAYHEYGINPLLLIQLPDDKHDSLSANEKKLIEAIKTYLDVKKNINVENNKLAIWLSGVKENVLGNEKKDCITEVLLFKQAIALGWDCPRAAVLLIFRDLHSMTFTIQTVGRILRMPDLHHYTNDMMNYGYVYTNLSTEQIEVVRDDMSYISKIAAKLRPEVENTTLPSVYQERRKTPHVLMSRFKKEFKKVVAEAWDIPLMEIYCDGDDWDNIKPMPVNNPDDFIILENRRKANLHGVRTDVKNIQVRVPKDLVLHGTEEVVTIDERARFCKTKYELTMTFNAFCRKNVGGYEPSQSAEMIRSALFEFFDEYLMMGSEDAIKVVLYEHNQSQFATLLAKAEERYTQHVYKKKEQERDSVTYHDFTWTLPELRVYNSEVSHNCETEIFHHALKPFFEENDASKPERAFSRMIDGETSISWWYKNGDKGKMHFAVPYTDKAGVPRCFYVDYIIRLKNGKICLFDTKTMGSDADAPAKHNALLEYAAKLNKTGRHIAGSIVIQSEDNQLWYYTQQRISTTDNIEDWTVLDFNDLN